MKDTCALYALGHLAVGTPGTVFTKEWAAAFRGCTVTMIPDRDEPSYKHFEKIAKLLDGVAASVARVDLPFPLEEHRGEDVRDLLQQPEGKLQLRKLLINAPVAGQSEQAAATAVDDSPKDSDLGNARRLVDLHGDSIRFQHSRKKWLVWNGRYWEIDQAGEINRLAKDVPNSLWLEVANTTNNELRTKLIRHATASENASSLAATVHLAKSDRDIPVRPEQLDRDPWLLNRRNGTIELKTGQLRSHDRGDYLTKMCPVDFDANAKAPLWERFLNTIFDGNTELIGYMQRLCGYWLTGDVSEQILPVFHGAGANGKSVFLGVIQGILGGDYSMKAVPDLLMAKRNAAHPTEKADLLGRRLVSCIESNDGQRLDESLVKELTGGDRIRARHMKEDFWEFDPSHKLVITSNHRPGVRGTDHGIWRRLHLVPFEVTIPESEQDKQLSEKLRSEYPGILAWAVGGCLEWQRDGLKCPDLVLAAPDDHRAREDLLGEFIRECCIVQPSVSVRSSELFAAYQKSTARKTTAKR